MNKRTEKAIAAWLALPWQQRRGEVFGGGKAAEVLLWDRDTSAIIARFTLASILKKRYPARKKKRAAK
jgi:hypothetical protein